MISGVLVESKDEFKPDKEISKPQKPLDTKETVVKPKKIQKKLKLVEK